MFEKVFLLWFALVLFLNASRVTKSHSTAEHIFELNCRPRHSGYALVYLTKCLRVAFIWGSTWARQLYLDPRLKITQFFCFLNLCCC